MSNKNIQEKSKRFAIRIVKLYKQLVNEKEERVMAKQILRSGTSIGANIAESDYAASKADFICKTQIAIKEAAETRYWLEILFETGFLSKELLDSLFFDCEEIIKILTTILNNSKADK
ncbi:MAG: four helix bundle protein [Firmicutes bacterium]|nr:four helix bundle protein [Bacillota bacterium]